MPITLGETLEEVRENLKEAVSLLLECYREEAEKRLSESAVKEDLVLQAA
ncbi:MAG: hypothetical protein M3388_12090 [Acidobacteriota bacterium]|nr:hypothetical protein [Acidobacteriota bacterium]